MLYRPDIDGLRAIAVLGVLVFHAEPSRLRGGFAGVDVFFVISGFLISSILLASLQSQTFSLTNFYVKRVKRIFPALLLTLVATLLLGWYVLLSDEYSRLGKHVVGTAFFVPNVVLWMESGYFDTASELKPLLHLWSLGIEEQFYFVWPFILAVFWRRPKHALWAMVGLMIGSFVLNVAFIHRYPAAVFYFPVTRFWELAAGGVLAYLQFHRKWRMPANIAQVSSWVGLILIGVAFLVLEKSKVFPGWWALLPVLGSILLISAGPETWINRRVLSWRGLVWVGLISYPLYLWHWPILVFGRTTFGESNPAIQIVAVMLSFLLAWLTYQYVERPIRSGKASQKRVRYLVPAALSCLALMGIAGQLIVQSHGFKHRLPVFEAIHEEARPASETYQGALAENCRAKFLDVDLCAISSPQSVPTVALIGDSHAGHFYPVMKEYYGAKGGNVVLLGRNGVPPFEGVGSIRDGRRVSSDDILDFVLKSPTISTVILGGFWSNYFEADGVSVAGERYKNRIVDRDENSALSQSGVFLKGMKSTISALVKAGKQVVFLYDIPFLEFSLRSCFPRLLETTTSKIKPSCILSREAFERWQAPYREAATSVLKEYPIVKSFDPTPFLCDDRNCYISRDNLVLFSDEHHLSVSGAEFFQNRFDF